MLIRRLEPADIDRYLAFRLSGLRESPDAFGSTWQEFEATSEQDLKSRFLPKGEDFIMCAFDENAELLGVAGFRRETRRKERHKGMLWGMYVALWARRNGVGRAIVERLIEDARKIEGIEQINLSVVAGQEPARNLYLSLGFEPQGVDRRALKDGERYFDMEHLVLYLTSPNPE